MDSKLFIIVVVLILFCGILGFGIGYYKGVTDTVRLGFKVVELGKINISVDQEWIERGIVQYRHEIAGCLFLEEDALVHDN